MERFSQPLQVYQDFQISTSRGFLPKVDPLRSLDGAFPAWENMAQNLPEIIAHQSVAKQLNTLNEIDLGNLSSPAQQERALQMLAFIGHAFLIESNQLIVPPLLARPWSQIARILKRPPVIAHPSYVLHNWYLEVPHKGISYENLRVSQALVGGKDEAAFILVTVWMEQLANDAIRAILKAFAVATRKDTTVVHLCLQTIREAIQAMTAAFDLMRRDCDPSFFYEHIRPYLASFNGLVMQGTADETPQNYHGGSAAQSSIFQSLDAALGIKSPPGSARDFLVKMRAYMPRPHARFIAALEKEQSLVKLCQSKPTLAAARQDCIEAIVAFRNEHLKIMAEYIIAPAKNQAILGTGGTHPSRFLKSVRDASKQSD